MNITDQDLDETRRVKRIIDRMEVIDANYVNSEMEIIFKKQPFFISLIMGYQLDSSPAELEELMKVILIIWEYFKTDQKFEYKKVTQEQFEKMQERNIELLKYIEGENSIKEKDLVMEYDVSHIKSKGLLTGIHFCLNTKSGFKGISPVRRGMLLIGMKALIECMEENKIYR